MGSDPALWEMLKALGFIALLILAVVGLVGIMTVLFGD